MFLRLRSAALAVAAAALVASPSALAQSSKPGASKPAPPSANAGAVARGRYLVDIMACNDCHTPLKMGPNGPEPDMTRLLSGHPASMQLPPPPAPSGPWGWTGTLTNSAFAGPWGISYSANITPDQNTGIGIWTEDMFIKAMRTGKHMGTSRQIQPPMPWNWIGKATDDDLKAIFAYLKSVPPIANRVPDVTEAAAPMAPGKSNPAAPGSAPKDAPAKKSTAKM